MKKLLLVIHDMRIGGAQKSLLSFLQCLCASPRGKEYEISLMPILPKGPLMAQLPREVRIVAPPRELHWLGTSLRPSLFTKQFSLRGLLGKLRWITAKGLRRLPKGLNTQQKLWHCCHDLIPPCSEPYDITISYMDGIPNYYVMEKVNAAKKTLWVHSEYQMQGYDPAYDAPYFQKADAIVTISQRCRDCLLAEFPKHGAKIHMLENITCCDSVLKKSREGICGEYEGFDGLRLLSVGRLHAQKGFDLAIEAAALLKQRGMKFLWLVVGEGSERSRLQEMIQERNLGACFRLLGARNNPYVYMSACDILVQHSRVEGMSIVLDEAKILCKPIVATNYTTVTDSIEDGKSGCVVDMTAESISEGIVRLAQDPALRQSLSAHLQALPKGNEDQLKKYLMVML